MATERNLWKGLLMTAKETPPRKTRYCKHYNICDREEDCMEGEHCDFFESNPDTFTMPESSKIDDLETVMDDIWSGEKELKI